MNTPDWSAARAEMMLDPEVTMLNTGSWGPVPRPVFDRATDIRRQIAAGPTDFYVRRLPPMLWHARCRLAEFLGTEPHRLVFAANVSVALNIVANGLRLAAGGEVLMTDHEYLSMQWMWERAARRQGLTLRTFRLPAMAEEPGEIVEAFRRELRPETRLLFFSHVLSPTGLALPAKEICAEARRRGVPTVVDGAHAAVTVDLNVDDVGADFYAGNSHKWLLAPSGSGFLVYRRGMEDRLSPMMVSWGWFTDRTDPDAPDEFGSTARTRFLEFEGTRDVVPWLVTPDAIDFQAKLGFDAIRRRMRELADYVREKIGPLGLRPATPRSHAMSGPMVAFHMPAGWTTTELRRRLWEDRVEINPVERPGGVLLRVSTHWYNTEADVDRLAGVLAKIL